MVYRVSDAGSTETPHAAYWRRNTTTRRPPHTRCTRSKRVGAAQDTNHTDEAKGPEQVTP